MECHYQERGSHNFCMARKATSAVDIPQGRCHQDIFDRTNGRSSSTSVLEASNSQFAFHDSSPRGLCDRLSPRPPSSPRPSPPESSLDVPIPTEFLRSPRIRRRRHTDCQLTLSTDFQALRTFDSNSSKKDLKSKSNENSANDKDHKRDDYLAVTHAQPVRQTLPTSSKTFQQAMEDLKSRPQSSSDSTDIMPSNNNRLISMNKFEHQPPPLITISSFDVENAPREVLLVTDENVVECQLDSNSRPPSFSQRHDSLPAEDLGSAKLTKSLRRVKSAFGVVRSGKSSSQDQKLDTQQSNNIKSAGSPPCKTEIGKGNSEGLDPKQAVSSKNKQKGNFEKPTNSLSPNRRSAAESRTRHCVRTSPSPPRNHLGNTPRPVISPSSPTVGRRASLPAGRRRAVPKNLLSSPEDTANTESHGTSRHDPISSSIDDQHLGSLSCSSSSSCSSDSRVSSPRPRSRSQSHLLRPTRSCQDITSAITLKTAGKITRFITANAASYTKPGVNKRQHVMPDALTLPPVLAHSGRVLPRRRDDSLRLVKQAVISDSETCNDGVFAGETTDESHCLRIERQCKSSLGFSEI